MSEAIEALFVATLRGDYGDDEVWQAVGELRANGTREIFDRAAAWCVSGDPRKRARAASILCQLEAAIGLGKRRDVRLMPKLRTMLEGPELNRRVAEAAAALLGLDEDPPEWVAADYVAVLKEKF